MLPVNSTAMDARLEVGLEQQAELMLKMMATLHADSILQALTSSSSTGKQRESETLAQAGVSLSLSSLSGLQSTRPRTGPTTAC